MRDAEHGGKGCKVQGGTRAAILFDGCCCGCAMRGGGKLGRDQKEEADKEALSEWRRDGAEGTVMQLTCSKNGLGHGGVAAVGALGTGRLEPRKC